MKITIKPKQKREDHDVPFNAIPAGYVYVVSIGDGPIALKLKHNEAVILNHSTGVDWFELAVGLKGDPACKILGKLTEIVVEEV
jgi:hypothetical protein